MLQILRKNLLIQTFSIFREENLSRLMLPHNLNNRFTYQGGPPTDARAARNVADRTIMMTF